MPAPRYASGCSARSPQARSPGPRPPCPPRPRPRSPRPPARPFEPPTPRTRQQSTRSSSIPCQPTAETPAPGSCRFAGRSSLGAGALLPSAEPDTTGARDARAELPEEHGGDVEEDPPRGVGGIAGRGSQGAGTPPFQGRPAGGGRSLPSNPGLPPHLQCLLHPWSYPSPGSAPTPSPSLPTPPLPFPTPSISPPTSFLLSTSPLSHPFCLNPRAHST